MMPARVGGPARRAGPAPWGAVPKEACRVTPASPGPKPPAVDADEERVPLFGTWPRIYAAVVLTAVVSIGLIALFSRYPW